MKIKADVKKKIFDKLIQAKPHLSLVMANELLQRLVDIDERLEVNLYEWLNDRPLSDVWINNKYCIGAIMKIRDDDDFVTAFLALDEYSKDVNKESFLWQARK